MLLIVCYDLAAEISYVALVIKPRWMTDILRTLLMEKKQLLSNCSKNTCERNISTFAWHLKQIGRDSSTPPTMCIVKNCFLSNARTLLSKITLAFNTIAALF